MEEASRASPEGQARVRKQQESENEETIEMDEEKRMRHPVGVSPGETSAEKTWTGRVIRGAGSARDPTTLFQERSDHGHPTSAGQTRARTDGSGLSNSRNQDRFQTSWVSQHRRNHVSGEPMRDMGSILEGFLMMPPIYRGSTRKDTWRQRW